MFKVKMQNQILYRYSPVFFRAVLAGLILMAISGCSNFSWYWQSVKGQLQIISQSEPVDALISSEQTPPELKQQLQLVSQLLAFAEQELLLPNEGSYTEYVDLQRSWVIKNLFVTDEFSIKLDRWCFPIAGCVGYRGYFDENLMQQDVEDLKAQNKDVYIGYIRAYSTLGWFDDPLLNTYINWPEDRLAGLIFHELAHQKFYLKDDTAFNESYATAVQQIGVERWRKSQGRDTTSAQKTRHRETNRKQVYELIEQYRQKLNDLYRSGLPQQQMRTQKQQLFEALRTDYLALSSSQPQGNGFTNWFKGELNNAKLASVSTYHGYTDAFHNLYRANAQDLSLFYREVQKLASLDKAQREECIRYWQQNSIPTMTTATVQSAIECNNRVVNYTH